MTTTKIERRAANQAAAQDALAAKKLKIEELLARLTQYAENLPAEGANWADVGSAEHIAQRLDDLCQFAGV